jgi:cytochrome c peroxidase
MLDDLAAFERVQYTNPRVRALSDAVDDGAATLPDPDLPLSELQEQGKQVFLRACAQCHGGASQSNAAQPGVRFHDIRSQCPRPVDPQGRYAFAACEPRLARNERTYQIRLANGTTIRRTSSDPGRALLTGFVGGPAATDDWNKFDVPALRGISHTAPYFHNNSAATLEDVVDHYIEFFKLVEVNFPPPAPPPPVATTDGVHFDRRPLPEERAALLAYLRRM